MWPALVFIIINLISPPEAISRPLELDVKKFKSAHTPMPNPVITMNQKSCTQIDLAPKMLPVKSQIGDTCSSYAAMELLQFETGKKFSAMHLAIISDGEPPGKEMSNPSILSTVKGLNRKFPWDAIKDGMEKGLCPEELIPDNNERLLASYKRILKYYEHANQKRDELDKACSQRRNEVGLNLGSLAIIFKHQAKKLTVWEPDMVKDEIKRAFPGMDTYKVAEIYHNSKNASDFMRKIVTERCKDELQRGIPKGKTTGNIVTKYNLYSRDKGIYFYKESERNSLLNHINETLERNRPIVIGYATGGLVLPVGTKAHAFHASAVAGRQWLPKQIDSDGKVTEAGCYYLIKNSWGPDWKVPSGLKASTSAKYPGFFLMSEKNLLEHVYQTTAIE